ncbi:hypothetical protein [Rhizobium grahamii]|uniref:Uncharacterized protein n=1 Tax=Rhizobium grahamii CCGE 502 TaxID=990285 RepID=S3IBL1_9HYPH|nr:hypothetical protein RGCCGE502_19645 [Rhizobium grahamii CCGE 502]
MSQQKAAHHGDEGQIQRLEEILSGLDEDEPTLKDMAMPFYTLDGNLDHTAASDEIESSFGSCV